MKPAYRFMTSGSVYLYWIQIPSRFNPAFPSIVKRDRREFYRSSAPEAAIW